MRFVPFYWNRKIKGGFKYNIMCEHQFVCIFPHGGPSSRWKIDSPIFSSPRSRTLWWGMTTNQRKRREILFEENLHKSKYYLRRFYTNPNIIWGGSTQIQILIEEILQKNKYHLRKIYTNPNLRKIYTNPNIIWRDSPQIQTLFDEILHKSKHYLRRFSTNQTLFEEIFTFFLL